MIGKGNFSGSANSRPLSNVHSPTLLFDYKDANGVTDWTNDQHMSLYADDESWAMMSLYDDPAETVNETYAYENEIMQFSTTDPLKFRRLLHHRSNIKNINETNGYWAMPKATISRAGRFIAYTSNWEDSGRYDLFIAKIEPPSQPTTPLAVTWANIANVNSLGNNLTATAASGRGETTQTINSGNGSIISTVTLNQPQGIVSFGLNSGPFTGLPSEIDFSWRVYDNGIAYPCINDVPLTDYVQTTTNDTLEVRINGTTIEWYHNGGSPVHTAPGQSLSYPYRGAVTLSASGNQILNVRMTGVASERTNVALAGNGGVTTVSSEEAPYSATYSNDGERLGYNSGHYSFWRDNTPSTWPDWLQIDFNGSKTIDEIDVYTVQDNAETPTTPTESMTFSLHGITGFEVQYWNGSGWTTVPGGSVSGNNKVWRKFTFTPVITSKIRVTVNSALNIRSRIVELEAWGTSAAPPRTNMALAGNGGVTSVSSEEAPYYSASYSNDGERLGYTAGHYSFWRDNTPSAWPDWLQIDFNGSKTIDEIDVYTVQDNAETPTTPTESMTFSLHGITGFEVQYWNGSAWTTVPGGMAALP